MTVVSEWAWRWRAYRARGDYDGSNPVIVWRYVYSPVYRVKMASSRGGHT